MTKTKKKNRIKDLQKMLALQRLDGYVSNDTLDQGFLTGFFRHYDDEGILLITRKDAVMVMKKMLVGQFKTVTRGIKAVGCQNNEILPFFLREIKKRKLKNVAFDPEKENYAIGKLWRKNKIKEKGGFIKNLRISKNPDEVAKIKKACRIAVKAFEIVRKKIKPGRTEKEIALELEYTMKNLGASENSFDPIVAGGKNGAFPHHETSNRKFKTGDVVLIDFGCKYLNYCSDITRTFYLGKNPPALFKKAYNAVVKAHDAAVKAIKPGVQACEIDKIAKKEIISAGFVEFSHGLGHGIGLEVHEPPALNKAGREILHPGMVFSVEPGIYLPGRFGIRHENLVVVTEKGCEIISK